MKSAEIGGPNPPTLTLNLGDSRLTVHYNALYNFIIFNFSNKLLFIYYGDEMKQWSYSISKDL